MAMRVQGLIAKLKKMPLDAVVVWRDHDQQHDEINGYVNSVEIGEPELVAARAAAGVPHKKIVVLST